MGASVRNAILRTGLEAVGDTHSLVLLWCVFPPPECQPHDRTCCRGSCAVLRRDRPVPD